MSSPESGGGPPGVGEAPRALLLPDTHGAMVSLGGPSLRPCLVAFLPMAFTPVCGEELDDLAQLACWHAEKVSIVGVSCDSMATLRAWQDASGAHEATLLSDFWPHGQAARVYGAFDAERGIARRASFLLDAGGAVRWRTASAAGIARPVEEYERAISELAPSDG